MKNNKHTFCCTYTTRLPHLPLLVCDQFHYILFNLIQLFQIKIGGTGFGAKLQHPHLCKAFLGASLILLHRPHAKRCRTWRESKIKIA